MRNVRFHDDARIELVEQVRYYEEASPGLGVRFGYEIEIAVGRAGQIPMLGSTYKYGTRRVFPKKFPFSVIYVIREQEVVILAIAHFRRKPAYWRKRRDDGDQPLPKVLPHPQA